MNTSTHPVFKPYDWQLSQWQRVNGMIRQGKIPHALLLTGQKGVGKQDFAHALAQLLLCNSPTENSACGSCKSCQLYKAGNHPDFNLLCPEEKSSVIKIDQIRELVDFVNKKSQFSGFKLALIVPGEAMNTSSSNALLKSLEEPGDNTVIIMISHSPSRLMATIRSRCQILNFPVPAKNLSLVWLQNQGVAESETLLSIASGLPLRALEMESTDMLETQQRLASDLLQLRQHKLDPLVVARQWEKLPPEDCLQCLIGWTLDWVRLKNNQPSLGFNLQKVHREIANSFDTSNIFAFWDSLKEALQQIQSNSNPNIKLMWTDLLIKWIKMK